MKIDIKNIAKINRAHIDIDTITVIAGENNTGKSTIGKSLFALFNGLYNIDRKIFDDKLEAIKWLMMRSFDHVKRLNTTILSVHISDYLAESITVEKLTSLLLSLDPNTDDIEMHVADILKQSIQQEYVDKLDNDEWYQLIKNVIDIIQIDAVSSINQIMTDSYSNEFYGQINNIYTESLGNITVTIKKQDISFTIKDNKVSFKEIPALPITKDIVYMDDPFILDTINGIDGLFIGGINTFRHRRHIAQQLRRENSNNSVETILTERKLDNIMRALNTICPGEFKLNTDSFEYIENNQELNVKNMSAGLKTFALLKQLVLNGTINQNGIVILDEPEIHLHPEWQLVFAELIVLLQIELGLHILLTTHSPYFLNAIEVYTAKYGIADQCKYYLTHNTSEGITFTDVTETIDTIYDKLARPLQKLENMRY